MKAGLKSIKNRIVKDDKAIFYLVSIIFAVIFSFAQMAGDDIGSMRVEGGTIADYWSKSVEMYATWSSRLFVNFSIFLFTDNQHTFLWGAYMGVSLYVMMYSLSKLFVNENQKKCNTVIASLVLLFPFQHLNSAGWIATMNTYFSPTAFGFLSLIPIKKLYKNEQIVWWEYILYSLALIYGANNEQMMIVIFGCYIVAVFYFALKKSVDIYCIFQLLFLILSTVLVMMCPGNYARKGSEIARNFKEWGMFNAIDKIDLGYSTTMHWLLTDSELFIIVICCLFAFLIWKKYRTISYAAIAGVPALLMILFSPLKSVLFTMYPQMEELTTDVEKNGLVTVVNRGDFDVFGKFFVWAMMVILLCITLLLLQENVERLMTTIVLMGTGVVSRMAIGFSPTIHVSSIRTFAILAFCIIAVACCIYSKSLEIGYLDEKSSVRIEVIAKVLIMCSLINILFLVA